MVNVTQLQEDLVMTTVCNKARHWINGLFDKAKDQAALWEPKTCPAWFK